MALKRWSGRSLASTDEALRRAPGLVVEFVAVPIPDRPTPCTSLLLTLVVDCFRLLLKRLHWFG